MLNKRVLYDKYNLFTSRNIVVIYYHGFPILYNCFKSCTSPLVNIPHGEMYVSRGIVSWVIIPHYDHTSSDRYHSTPRRLEYVIRITRITFRWMHSTSFPLLARYNWIMWCYPVPLSPGIDLKWVCHVDTLYYFPQVSVWSDIDITWVCHVDTSYYFHRVSIWPDIDRTWVCHVNTSYYFYRLSCDRPSTSLGYQYCQPPLSPGITYPTLSFNLTRYNVTEYRYHLGMSCWYHITFIAHSFAGWLEKVNSTWVSIWTNIDSTWVCHVDTPYYFYRLSMWSAIDITWVSILTYTTFTGYHIPHIIFQFDRISTSLVYVMLILYYTVV
jgi:hypothetical protein